MRILYACVLIVFSGFNQASAGFIYGIADDNQLYEINPETGVFRSLYNTGLTGNSNAVAYDAGRDQLLFINPGTGSAKNNLWVLDRDNINFTQAATGTQMGITGINPANASFYNDAFWFFQDGTNVLYNVQLNYADPAAPVFSAVDTINASLGSELGENFDNNKFGDIAITDQGILYGYTSRGVGGNFYRYNLANNQYTWISATPGAVGVGIGLQLAWNGDFTVLYGHNYEDGKWYSINIENGALTDLNFVTLVGNTGFRDLGGSSITSAPIPEPSGLMMVLGVAAAAASRRWRPLRGRGKQ